MKKLIRKTKSVCPVCIKEIDADIVGENNKIFMEKTCIRHGKFKVLLSKDARYYKEVYNAYCLVNKDIPKRNYFNIYLTLKCNLYCPICLTRANQKKRDEISPKEIKNILIKNRIRKAKIGLWGGEPTLREDLIEIIKVVKETKNIPALYTNGIRISDYGYLKKLKKSGLDIVHFQFDGFDDRVYKKLRGKDLLEIKKKALENLKKLNVPTILETTFLKNLNEKEIPKVFDFALGNNFIKAVLFRSYSHIGRAGFSKEEEILDEEIIKYLRKGTSNKINKKKILDFQKLLFIIYDLLKTKRCFYNKYLILIRKGKNYVLLNDLVNVKKIYSLWIRYKKIRNKLLSKIYFLFMLKIFAISNLKNLGIIIKMLPVFIKNKILGYTFTSSSLPKEILIVGIGCICNSYNYDKDASEYCIGGEITPEGKIFSSLCDSNLDREKEFKLSK